MLLILLQFSPITAIQLCNCNFSTSYYFLATLQLLSMLANHALTLILTRLANPYPNLNYLTQLLNLTLSLQNFSVAYTSNIY